MVARRRAPTTHPLVGATSRLERLVIRPGESGGLFTRTGFVLAKICTEEILRMKPSYRLIKRRDFAIEDIQADSIRELQKVSSDSSSSKISEFFLDISDIHFH